MSLINKEVKEFIDLLDSKRPTPGGGSASALISVIGLSLARMVGHLTIDKKAFLALPTDVQEEFKKALSSLLTLKEQLMPLIDQDAASFDAVMAAYRLPRETEQEQEIRKISIQEATLGAIKVPLEIASLSLTAFNYINVILEHGNTLAITDVGVSVLSLAAGIEGALLNVLINLGSLNDNTKIEFYKTKVDNMLKETKVLKERLLAKVYNEL